jgi:chromate transporter
VILAPQFGKVLRNPRIRLFVAGVTAAAIGALMGAVIVFAMRTLRDSRALVIAAGTLGIVLKWPRTPEPAVVAGAAIVGLVLRLSA